MYVSMLYVINHDYCLSKIGSLLSLEVPILLILLKLGLKFNPHSPTRRFWTLKLMNYNQKTVSTKVHHQARSWKRLSISPTCVSNNYNKMKNIMPRCVINTLCSTTITTRLQNTVMCVSEDRNWWKEASISRKYYY